MHRYFIEWHVRVSGTEVVEDQGNRSITLRFANSGSEVLGSSLEPWLGTGIDSGKVGMCWVILGGPVRLTKLGT